MKRMILAVFILVTALVSVSEADEYVKAFSFGDETVKLHVEHFSAGPAIVVLHDNRYALKAARSAKRGTVLWLEYRPLKRTRELRFIADGTEYRISMNRIFTEEGIMTHLKPYSEEVHTKLSALANDIVAESRMAGGDIIALFNNADGGYSAESYIVGNSQSVNASEVSLVKGRDTDDFYIVILPGQYERVKVIGYNTVMQSPEPEDDGSLSALCARKCLSYISIMTQNGDATTQGDMLAALLEEEQTYQESIREKIIASAQK